MYRVYSKTLDADILLVGTLLPSLRMLRLLNVQRVKSPTPGKETLELGANVGQLERMYSRMGVLFEKSRQGYNSLAIRKQGIDFVYWYRPEFNVGTLVLYRAIWMKDAEGNYVKDPKVELGNAPSISLDAQALTFKMEDFFGRGHKFIKAVHSATLTDPICAEWNLDRTMGITGVQREAFNFRFFAKVREEDPSALHNDMSLSLLLVLHTLEQDK